MADYFYGRMYIGGSIKRADFACFVEAVRSETQPAFQDGLMKLDDEQARYGEFPRAEDLAQTMGFSYRRFSRGQHEHNPQVALFTPDQYDAAQSYYARKDGTILTPFKETDMTVEEAQNFELPELTLVDDRRTPEQFLSVFDSLGDRREAIMRESDHY